MIYRIFIVLVLLCTVIYYLFCFLQIFEIIRFTDDDVEVEIPQMFIPFYYLLKKGKKKNENVAEEVPDISEVPEETPIQAISAITKEPKGRKYHLKETKDEEKEPTKKNTRK